MRFIDFITENTEKHGVFAFGRFNPPTVGHSLVVNKVHEVAKKHNASHDIVLSHSHDAKKNPLSSEQKLTHAKRFFPHTNLSVASKEKPSLLHHLSDLHKKGVTHLHMVAGGDRVHEYHKLIHQYNGKTGPHGHFHFKHIEVHSAGDRDPDSEDTSGMSASKMRKHAGEGNYHEFKKGIPSHVSDSHAKELYHHVRHGMNIKEDINLKFEMMLNEGVHDHGIFKAVFLGGGPGSGKDHVMKHTLMGHGMTEVNSDNMLEYLMDKEKLDKTMPDSEEAQRNALRKKAKNSTELRQRLAIHGRNGLIINGTADDPEKIASIKAKLEKLGYDTKMLMIHTADEVSHQRNIARGQRGGRTVPEDIRKQKWDAVQAAKAHHARLFGSDYHEYDNSHDDATADPETKRAKQNELLGLFKTIRKFTKTPPKHERAQSWIGKQLQKKDTEPISKSGAAKLPPHTSEAAKKAGEMGLQYYGTGRYGSKGRVTHRVVNDNLIDVSKTQREAEKKPKVTKKKKKINESFINFLNESVSLNITADSPEEIKRVLKLLKSDEEDVKEESNEFSDNTSYKLLMLGTSLKEEKNVQILKETFFEERNSRTNNNGRASSRTSSSRAEERRGEEGVSIISEESCTTGKITLQQIRDRKKAQYQKESIDKGTGTVEIVLNKKQINESWMTDKEISDKIPKTALKQIHRHVFYSRLTNHNLAHGGSGNLHYRHNIDNNGFHSVQVASNKKDSEGYTHHATFHITKHSISHGEYETTKDGVTKNVSRFGYANESIDKAIEPGLSMAASGESPDRDMGEKNKKKTGKATQVSETIGGSGEMATSMSDQKEDELKKQGISLKTWRAKRPIGA